MKLLSRVARLAVTAIVLAASSVNAQEVLVDKSEIRFVAKQLGVNVEGRFRKWKASVVFLPADLAKSKAEFDIDLASIDLGDPKWNTMVASGQFLDTKRWPTARYVSTTIEPRDATHARVHGELDFRGVKKPLDLDVTLNRVGTDPYAFKQKAGFSATATLDRFAFGMDRYKDVVAAAIDLRFEIEGIRDRNAADKSGDP